MKIAKALIIVVPSLIIVSFLALRRTRTSRIARFVFSEISINNVNVKGDLVSMELKEGQKAVLVATPKTRGGHPAGVQTGSARWTSSDDSVISVEQDPTNELGAVIRGLDGSKNESVVVELRADGDPGEGQKEVVGTIAITCTQGDAATFDLELSSIEDDVPAEQPPPTGTADGKTDTAGSAGTDVTDPNADKANSDPNAAGKDAGGDVNGGAVKAGDPGTVTGGPIDGGDAPKGDAPFPGANTDTPTGSGTDAAPIAGADTAGADNPVKGTEADSAKPAGDDVQSPSNLPGTGGNGF